MTMYDLKPDKPDFARAGKIRLGIKVKNKGGVEYPKEVEYFVLRDVPELVEHFLQTIGTDKPTELPIFFPFDDIDDCLIGWHKLHMASSLWCKGDGRIIDYAIDTQTGKRVISNGIVIREFSLDDSEFYPGDTVHCPGHQKANPWKRCKFCSPHTILKFMIRGLPVEKLEMAMYHVETTSVNNYPRLYEQLLGIKRLAKMLKGREYLTGIPIILRRVKEQMGSPNLDKNGNRKQGKDGNLLPARMRTEHYLLELQVESKWVQEAIEGQMQLMSPANSSLITAIIDSNGDDQEFVEGEFVNNDYADFKLEVIKQIPFFTDETIDKAMEELELIFDPENKELIFDALAKYADEKANEEAAKQEKLL